MKIRKICKFDQNSNKQHDFVKSLLKDKIYCEILTSGVQLHIPPARRKHSEWMQSYVQYVKYLIFGLRTGGAVIDTGAAPVSQNI